MRIPFDNVALSAIISELGEFMGGTVQEVRQPDEYSVSFKIFRRGEGERGVEGTFLICVHPQFARAHFITRRLAGNPKPPVFCATLRSRLIGTKLIAVEQIASDRILTLSFAGEAEGGTVIAELMGKHSNAMLLDARNHLVGAAKWVPRSKSSRPILSDAEYEWPPVLDGDLLQIASPKSPQEWIRFAETHPKRVSPFFRELAPRIGRPSAWTSSLASGVGAYPLSLEPLGVASFDRQTFSIALEQVYAVEQANFALETLRSGLLGQIDRIIAGREVAISEIEETLRVGEQADSWQTLGQLILAYGPSVKSGAQVLDAWDYQGNPVSISLDPELGYVENSTVYFEKAKKAKNRASHLSEMLERLEGDRLRAIQFREQVASADSLDLLEDLKQSAKDRRWLTQQPVAKVKEERPYEGHRIRELLGPGGVRVLFGENAESNDYLTLRVARPNDYWLHVRGAQSAHVVLVTGNAPDKIQREQLLFAAKVAVLNSGSKHASYVPVDYTLKKYVRKPKGAPKGSALYTHEKTLHVEG